MVAEDQMALRDALVDLFNAEPDLIVVASASDAVEAIAAARIHRPQVAVLDVRMPNGGGLRVARAIRDMECDTRVIALSAYEDEATMAMMRTAGAAAYILKGSDPHALLTAVRGDASDVVGHPPQPTVDLRYP